MNFTSNKPIYIQIADLICEKILVQIFKEEDRIPSVRELAIDLEVNPNTVMRTYEYLQELAIIYNKRGVGFFVSLNGMNKASEYLKKECMEKDMPSLFKKINLLKITFREIKELYLQYLKNSNN